MHASPYADYAEHKGWAPESFGKYTPLEARFYQAELLGLVRGARVLEIGFGNGAFLGWARDQGAEVCGVELQEELVQRAREAGFRAFPTLAQALEDMHGRALDTVVAQDVIEHVADDELVGWLRSVVAPLGPGGHLFLKYPNGDSPFGRFYQHGDLTHRSTIGSLKLRQMAQHAGCSVVHLRNPYQVVARGGPLVAALKKGLFLAGRWTLERLMQRLFLDGHRVPLGPNVVALLRKAP